jgi:predicted transcriptional regulator
MLTINQKLEIFRKIYCLGDHDIKKIFGEKSYEDYWKFKYESSRETFDSYGNFHFLFQLDEDNAKKVLDYVGFKDPNNSVRFVTDAVSDLKNN